MISKIKLRNILSKIKKKTKHRKKLIKQASEIFKAKDREKAIIRINRFVKQWQDKEPLACKCLKKDLGDYLKYYEFPAKIRDKLKSTNALERILREIRRITDEEKSFIERIREIFTTEKKEKKIGKHTFAVVIKEIPQFVGVSGKEYGPFKPGDIIKIDERDLEILIRKGLVKVVEEP